MTTRLLVITGWLAAGHAALAGLFYVCLQVPESNVLMLAISTILALLMGVGAGVVETAAIAAWQGDRPWRAAIARAVAGLPFFVLAAVAIAALWWLTGLGFRWAALSRSEIDAWLMARWGWTRTGGLHVAVDWLLRTVRFALGTSLGVALVAAGLHGGWGAVRSAAWIWRALAPRQWIPAGLALLVFIWLPWQAVNWRPAFVAGTWAEPVAVAVKLAGLYLVGNLGWALALAPAARRPARHVGATHDEG